MTRRALVPGRDRVIAHATVTPFPVHLTVPGGAVELTVGGICQVIHKAADGSLLVRTMGGYRVYVNPDQVQKYEEVD